MVHVCCYCQVMFCTSLFLGGLETEKEYPYEAVGEKCKFIKSDAVVTINGSLAISKDENGLSC